MKSFNKIAEFIKTSEEKDELNRIYGELMELSKAFYGEVENKVQILLEMGVPEELVKSIQDEIIGGAYETALAMEWNSMKTKLSDVKDINDLIKRATDEGSPFPYEIQEQLAEMKLEEAEDENALSAVQDQLIQDIDNNLQEYLAMAIEESVDVEDWDDNDIRDYAHNAILDMDIEEAEEMLSMLGLSPQPEVDLKEKTYDPEHPIVVVDAAHDGSMFDVEFNDKYFRAHIESGVILDEVGHEVDNKEFENRIWTAINAFIDKKMIEPEQI